MNSITTASEVKERPIQFFTSMVQAILEGKKKQTRRILKPQPNTAATHFRFDPDNWSKKPWIARVRMPGEPERYEITNQYKCPFGKPGDRLWVREKIMRSKYGGFWNRSHDSAEYRVDYFAGGFYNYFMASGEEKASFKEKIVSPIHMRRFESRILLEITSIRIERLQDITAEDAIAEGIASADSGLGYLRYTDTEPGIISNPVKAFATLWQSIYGEGSFRKNPWVWVVEFKRI